MSQSYAFVIPGIDPQTAHNAVQIVCDREDRRVVDKAIFNVVGSNRKVYSKSIRSKYIQLDAPFEFIVMTQDLSPKEERNIVLALCDALQKALGHKRVSCI